MKIRLVVCSLLLAVAAAAQTTPNVNLNLPNYSVPNWNIPLNGNFTLLDSMLSGNTALSSALDSVL